MRFSLGFSPCPNDTFIFDALVNKKMNLEDPGIEFDVFLEDVETLNEWALQGRLDISKISYGVLPLVLGQYTLLDAGGALGKGVGPLLISRKPMALTAIDECTIAIPGRQTTAHLLFSLARPHAHRKQFMVFSDIEEAVVTGAVDCGVIIHENRFTYQQKGLVRLMDLGEFWEETTGAPIPLGGIVVRKDMNAEHAKKINRLIKESLEYAFARLPQLPEYVREHAQEMDESVMRKHIDLYVNEYSLSLGEDGERAVRILLQTYARVHGGEPASLQLF
jgi:1,4-dihydroxy-6-naphthoate synthase